MDRPSRSANSKELSRERWPSLAPFEHDLCKHATFIGWVPFHATAIASDDYPIAEHVVLLVAEKDLDLLCVRCPSLFGHVRRHDQVIRVDVQMECGNHRIEERLERVNRMWRYFRGPISMRMPNGATGSTRRPYTFGLEVRSANHRAPTFGTEPVSGQGT